MKIAVHFLRKALKASKLDGALHIFILNTAKVLLWILLTVTILSHLGVSTTSFSDSAGCLRSGCRTGIEGPVCPTLQEGFSSS